MQGDLNVLHCHATVRRKRIMPRMQGLSLRSWPRTTRSAIETQNALRDIVSARDSYGDIETVAGVDVGFLDGGTRARAAVAVLEFPSLVLLESAVALEKVRFPYVPGLLSFREIPVVVKALRKLRRWPDLILCDAHGYAHPRRFGLACHLGVLTDTPSIGVAKSRLIGTHASLGGDLGATTPLRHAGEEIGALIRTRAGVQPVYVSVGHRVSLPSAIRWTLACVTRYRLPETTRWAHRLASGT